jgi:hypothetical protein
LQQQFLHIAILKLFSNHTMHIYTPSLKDREYMLFCHCVSNRNKFWSQFSQQLLVTGAWNFSTVFVLAWHMVEFIFVWIWCQCPVYLCVCPCSVNSDYLRNITSEHWLNYAEIHVCSDVILLMENFRLHQYNFMTIHWIIEMVHRIIKFFLHCCVKFDHCSFSALGWIRMLLEKFWQ